MDAETYGAALAAINKRLADAITAAAGANTAKGNANTAATAANAAAQLATAAAQAATAWTELFAHYAAAQNMYSTQTQAEIRALKKDVETLKVQVDALT